MQARQRAATDARLADRVQRDRHAHERGVELHRALSQLRGALVGLAEQLAAGEMEHRALRAQKRRLASFLVTKGVDEASAAEAARVLRRAQGPREIAQWREGVKLGLKGVYSKQALEAGAGFSIAPDVPSSLPPALPVPVPVPSSSAQEGAPLARDLDYRPRRSDPYSRRARSRSRSLTPPPSRAADARSVVLHDARAPRGPGTAWWCDRASRYPIYYLPRTLLAAQEDLLDVQEDEVDDALEAREARWAARKAALRAQLERDRAAFQGATREWEAFRREAPEAARTIEEAATKAAGAAATGGARPPHSRTRAAEPLRPRDVPSWDIGPPPVPIGPNAVAQKSAAVEQASVGGADHDDDGGWGEEAPRPAKRAKREDDDDAMDDNDKTPAPEEATNAGARASEGPDDLGSPGGAKMEPADDAPAPAAASAPAVEANAEEEDRWD